MGIPHNSIYAIPKMMMLRSVTARSLTIAASRRAAMAAPNASQVRLYHENIVEHYENPRNVGSLDKMDSSVGTVRAVRVWPSLGLFLVEIVHGVSELTLVCCVG
jgi:NifU-like N terminal domain